MLIIALSNEDVAMLTMDLIVVFVGLCSIALVCDVGAIESGGKRTSLSLSRILSVCTYGGVCGVTSGRGDETEEEDEEVLRLFDVEVEELCGENGAGCMLDEND